MATSQRFRNFAIIIYPESAPENWLEVISDWHVSAFLSPLHDKDENPDGESKKPHYHLLLFFDGVKSLDQIQELSDQLCGVSPEIVKSLRGYARYLCHLDNPEKYQYPVEEVRSFTGESYLDVIGLPCDRYKILDEMISFCRDTALSSYADLLFYCQDSGKTDWLRVALDSTFSLTGFFKSLKYSRYWNDFVLKVEDKNGEVSGE